MKKFKAYAIDFIEFAIEVAIIATEAIIKGIEQIAVVLLDAFDRVVEKRKAEKKDLGV